MTINILLNPKLVKKGQKLFFFSYVEEEVYMLHVQEVILQVCVCASVEKTYYPLYKFSQLLDSVPSLSGWVLIGQKATNSDCGNTIGVILD